ncbi:unnamed protein product [Brassica rapa subsp. narinosa]
MNLFIQVNVRCQLSFFYFKALFVRKERKIKALSTT